MKKKISKKHVYVVILGGGVGTRFWPLSRQSLPKQFLKIFGEETLFEKTIKRVLPLINPVNIFVVANKKHAPLLRQQIRRFRIPSRNILLEPEPRNTAPSIGWTASVIHKKDPEAIMVVLPADHIIKNVKQFHAYLKKAIYLAQKGFLVTFGIVPTRPERGYGYLKCERVKIKGETVTVVRRFIEKPSQPKAEKFFKEGGYLWNSGMFIWKTSTILEEFRRSLPKIYKTFQKQCTCSYVWQSWFKLPKISIDYGIMEKAKTVVTVPALNLGWSDVGSWEALYHLLRPGKKANVCQGDVILSNSSKTLIWGGQRLIAAMGLENLVIIDTPDALLVCRLDFSQDVRDIVSFLQEQKRKEI